MREHKASALHIQSRDYRVESEVMKWTHVVDDDARDERLNYYYFVLSRSSLMVFVCAHFHNLFFSSFSIYAAAAESEQRANVEMLAHDQAENGGEHSESVIFCWKHFSAFDSLIPNLLLKWIDAIKCAWHGYPTRDTSRLTNACAYKLWQKSWHSAKWFMFLVSIGCHDAIWQSFEEFRQLISIHGMPLGGWMVIKVSHDFLIK